VQFNIELSNKELMPSLYNDYSKFLFSKIKETISLEINSLKYKVREPYILSCSIIEWAGNPPKSIDLERIIKNCLVLKRIKGTYVIKVSNRKIPGTYTKMSTLVRLLEYGNEDIPPYPLIRSVFKFYYKIYKDLIPQFMNERMFGNECLPIRQSSRRKVRKHIR
jgi:hypothetical protein